MKSFPEKIYESPVIPIILSVSCIVNIFLPGFISGSLLVSSFLAIMWREFKLYHFFDGLECDRELYQKLKDLIPYSRIREIYSAGRVFRKDEIEILSKLENFLEEPTHFFINSELNAYNKSLHDNLKKALNLLRQHLRPVGQDSNGLLTLGSWGTYPRGDDKLSEIVNEISSALYNVQNSCKDLCVHARSTLRV